MVIQKSIFHLNHIKKCSFFHSVLYVLIDKFEVFLDIVKFCWLLLCLVKYWILQKFNLCVNYVPTDWLTDVHTLLYRCENAFKNWSKSILPNRTGIWLVKNHPFSQVGQIVFQHGCFLTCCFLTCWYFSMQVFQHASISACKYFSMQVF